MSGICRKPRQDSSLFINLKKETLYVLEISERFLILFLMLVKNCITFLFC